MKFFSAHIEDLKTLYITELKKALDMEQKITKALPEMIDNSSDPDLVQAFRTHLDQTQGHVEKVRSLVEKYTDSDSTETCHAINGLANEAAATMKDVTNPDVRDIALIGAGQQVEHHEIAVYGTLKNWAGLLGANDDVRILTSIESEEFQADQLLTRIAESVNSVAA